jgi:hypothetical protein
MKIDILAEAHGGQFTGHDGIFKTKERILNCYYWPGMDKDINEFIKNCVKCQLRTKSDKNHTELQPLPQCSAPSQRIHADLFGPLKTSDSGKKYILCMTDAFTKYVELVALPDKEAETVAQAMFHRWICRYGTPLQVTTDGGKEFCAKLSEELYKRLDIEHLKTSPYHPQCNAQAEIVNKTIAKYLSTFVDETTLNWETYLPPLMFAYNTSVHSTTKFTPFFLTFGQQPRAPHFPTPDITRKFYGESSIDEMWLKLQQTRRLAMANNDQVRENYEQKYNKTVIPIVYAIGQEVFLDEHNFLHKNKKLAPKFSGPHIIEKLIGKTNAQLKLKNGRSTIVHLNRIKPFLSQSDKLVEQNLIDKDEQRVDIHPPSPFSEDEMDNDDTPLSSHKFLGHPQNPTPTVTTQVVGEEPPKRKRGRPRKAVIAPQGTVSVDTPPPPVDQQQETPGRITRSQLQQMSEQERLDYFAVSVIKAIAQLSPIKKQKLKIKHKHNKNGTGNAKWSKLQTRNFKIYGDVDGETISVSEGYPEPPAENNDNDDDQYIEYEIEPEIFFEFDPSDAEWEEYENDSNSEWERDWSSEPGDERPPQEDDQAAHQGGHDGGEKEIPKAPDKMAQGKTHNPPRPLLHVQPNQLPNFQRLPGHATQRHPLAPQAPPKAPTSTVSMHSNAPVSARTHHDTPGAVPSSTLHSQGTSQHQNDDLSHAGPTPKQGPTHSQVLKLGPSALSKNDPIHPTPVARTSTSTGATARTTLPTPKLSRAPVISDQEAKRRSNDIGLLAQIVGLSPTSLSKQTKASLIGDLVAQAARPSVPSLARQRSDPELASPKQSQGHPRPTTPTHDATEQQNKEAVKTMAQAKTILKAKEELAKEGLNPFAELSRPTRSTFVAPPIQPLPKIPIERKKKKTAEEIEKEKLTQKQSSPDAEMYTLD